VTIGITGGKDPPRGVAAPDRGREPREDIDLTAPHLGLNGGPRGNGEIGTSEGAAIPERLKSLPQRRIGQAEHHAELGLLEPLDQ
jgi:hypothetical protein